MGNTRKIEGASGSAAALPVLYLAAFVSAFNENIINVALVDIIGEFGVSAGVAQWLVTGYMIVCAIIIMLMAFLSRKFTTRQLFFAAATCMVAGEVLCFVAPAFPILLASRLLQAVGSGIFIPLMMSGVLALSPRDKIGSGLAIGSACITLGPAFAPVLSGLVTTAFGWRSVFVIPGAATLLLALISLKVLPNISETERCKLDVPSVVLAALGLTAFVYSLGELISNTLVGVIGIVVAVALLLGFAKRQRGLEVPVLNMSPLSKRRFSLAVLMLMVSMMTSFSMSVLLPMYFEDVFGMTALFAGLMILPPIAANAVAAVVSGKIMDKYGEWPLIPIGFACTAGGMVAIAALATSMNLPAIVGFATLSYCGIGLCMAPSQTAGLKSLSHSEHPHGVSILNVMIMVSASFGPSLFIGAMSFQSGAEQAAGTAYAMAQAEGFGFAVWIAAAIGVAGFLLSFIYSWRAHKTSLAAAGDVDGHQIQVVSPVAGDGTAAADGAEPPSDAIRCRR